MTEEKRVLHRKVLLKLLAYPWALVPSTLGLSALVLSWSANLSDWVTFGGGVGILAGLGLYLTRGLFGVDGATRDAVQELQHEQRKAREAHLDDLDARLLADRDPRTEVLLRKLRALAREVEEKGLGGELNRRTRVEISLQVDELYKECVRALEKSLDLWDKAQRVEDTATRAKLYDAREAEIVEVDACVKVLERLVGTELATVSDDRRDNNLARIREELRANLEIARRVEERMQSLEDEIPDQVDGIKQ